MNEDGTLDWRSRVEPRELPDEWVLRQLCDADLDDDRVVQTLLEAHGAIPSPYFDPAQIPADRRSLLSHLPSHDEDRAWWRERSDGTIEDARWWLMTARSLARMWAAASAGDDVTDAWNEFPALDNERSCWVQFSIALNEGLRPFRAHVEHAVALSPAAEITYGLPRVGLYSAACRQIFNFVVRDETARRCENETCEHIFVHQLGGAKYRQHRTIGLRFCTPECARAQTQREYRRRHKAAQHKETS